ncbi:MAG: tannase/feruloyl esterase family alpha/beta hydrolase [Proteobacteria bacterium]|nr:tannase/feruloyl esterase family alpha/beta hydrolase [Pseudomonadota bacterium]
MKKTRFLLICVALASGSVPISAWSAAPPPARCAALAKFTVPGHTLQIDKAQNVPAGPGPAVRTGPPGSGSLLPAHCRVDGVIDARTGRNGKPYGIGFALALPADWNGRFFFQGGGGLNGVVSPPIGPQATGDATALASGFAVVSNDSGHQGAGFDATFMEDQEALLNFLYQANATVTVIAKQMVEKYYGKAPHHSYWVGCSTGGREAMMMSQRFPKFFDGIVAGAPAIRTNFSNLGLRWGATAMNAIAPKDAQGRPQTRLALSDSDRKLVVDGMLAACDAIDGSKDGLVFAPQACKFDPQVLVCTGAKNEGCLTVEQVAAVKKIMTGPKTALGRQVYPGYYWDTGIITQRGLPGILVGPVIPESPTSGTSMDVDAEEAVAHDGRQMAGDTNGWTNLSTFNGRGGKLIFYHGVSDPWFSAQETVNYYERLQADNGPAPTSSWSRLFLVPGMGHCGGGERTLDSFDMLTAIVDWVEKGQAPEQVIAKGASAPGETRPLCPWPTHAQYSGSGDAKNAASYRCAQ